LREAQYLHQTGMAVRSIATRQMGPAYSLLAKPESADAGSAIDGAAAGLISSHRRLLVTDERVEQPYPDTFPIGKLGMTMIACRVAAEDVNRPRHSLTAGSFQGTQIKPAEKLIDRALPGGSPLN